MSFLKIMLSGFLNGNTISKILAILGGVLLWGGLLLSADGGGYVALVGLVCLIVSPIIYFNFNSVRTKRKMQEEINRQEFKDALRRANRFSCPQCGTVVEGNQCPGCNAIYPDMKPSKFDKKKSYAGWYILSILLGFLGGIIAYAALRNENNAVAKNCLFVGIIVTVFSIIIAAITGFL